MPVGRFRDDPREFDEGQRSVYARQYPEGLHVVGSLLGLGIPIGSGYLLPSAPAALTGPLTAVGGLVVGGVAGYLLGYWYRERRLGELEAGRKRRASTADEPDGSG